MAKLILALLAGVALMLAAGGPAARADTSCTGLITGTISGNVVVRSGICTLLGATVTGNVTVETGASLAVDPGSTVKGNISADQCNFVQINGGVSVNGNVSIQNCNGAEIGYGIAPVPGPLGLTQIKGNFLCQGNSSATGAFRSICNANNGSVGGNVQVDDNDGAFVMGNSVGGNVQVDNNSKVAVSVQANSVGGNMQVDDNSAGAILKLNSVGGNVQVNNNGPPTSVVSETVNGNLVCQGNTSLTESDNTVHGTTHCP
jgi:hypothetical protein